MAKYFFHVHDGLSPPDQEGTELINLQQARIEAVRRSGSLLRDHPSEFWQGEDWSIDVTDATGIILFTLHVFATEAPSLRG